MKILGMGYPEFVILFGFPLTVLVIIGIIIWIVSSRRKNNPGQQPRAYCPQCHNPVGMGIPQCPHCGTVFSYTAPNQNGQGSTPHDKPNGG